MTSKIISNLEAKNFLNQVLATPYSEEEKRLDRLSFVKKVLFEAIFTPFFQPVTVFSTVWKTLFSSSLGDVSVINDSFIARIKQTEDQDVVDKFVYAKETTEELAKQMGLSSVVVVVGPQSDNESTLLKGVVPVVSLSPETLEEDREIVEHTIAHELAHIQHNDYWRNVLVEWVDIVVQVVVFRYFGALHAYGNGAAILTVVYLFGQISSAFLSETSAKIIIGILGLLTPIIQIVRFRRLKVLPLLALAMVLRGVASVIKRAIAVSMERAADEKALLIVNSNNGMVQRCYLLLKDYFDLKQTSVEELQEKYPTSDVQELQRHRREITPHGNDRDDDIHPPITERLAHALNFKPVTAKI
jgi:Zn-dependent protease with chaperone function